MLSHFCEGTEVASALGISFDTLDRRVREEFETDFADYKAKKRALGERELRELQIKTARRSVTMQIWLGKQYLNQKDRSDYTSGNEKIQPLNITVAEKSTTEKLQKLINEPVLN